MWRERTSRTFFGESTVVVVLIANLWPGGPEKDAERYQISENAAREEGGPRKWPVTRGKRRARAGLPARRRRRGSCRAASPGRARRRPTGEARSSAARRTR